MYMCNIVAFRPEPIMLILTSIALLWVFKLKCSDMQIVGLDKVHVYHMVHVYLY